MVFFNLIFLSDVLHILCCNKMQVDIAWSYNLKKQKTKMISPCRTLCDLLNLLGRQGPEIFGIKVEWFKR